MIDTLERWTFRTLPPLGEGEQEWVQRGLCRAAPFDYFSAANAREAKATCAACPVLEECRALCDRIEADIQTPILLRGNMPIWGGETASERVRRRRAEATPLP